jgi:hypothetical protein
MLPFTTYTIPETAINKMANEKKWLLFISDQPFSLPQKELVQKIGTAVKADFDRDTFCWSTPLNSSVSILEITNSSSRLVISFGISPSALGLWIDLQSPGIRFLEKFSFILTLPIIELEKNAAAKKELWKNMQMFMEMNEKQDG